tara:strand:- start:908 stop:1093 length:186 start_codon:yes stop_codon:yes gene_type:complete
MMQKSYLANLLRSSKIVELLTSGASATYASDSVAGVVNFIMDDSLIMGTECLSGNSPLHLP